MEVFRYIFPFRRRTGIITCPEKLDEIGIDPCDRHGCFLSNRSGELVRFCRINPEFHVVSYMNPNLKFNKLVPGAIFYFLADGDPDPRLIYATSLKDEDLEIFELRIAQLTA